MTWTRRRAGRLARGVRAVAMGAGLLAVVPAGLAAQNSPTIRSAIQLAAEGRSDSAQRLVGVELARARVGDPAWVEALYWRARLATYGDSAERDLRRVALEYSSSPWADDALLQLSQLALAAGNPASAFELAGRVRSDYPGSELRTRAALWAARAAFEVGEPRTACALLDTARTEGAADIEFVNQVMFYRGRCTAAMLAPPASSAPLPRPAAVADSPAAPAPAVAVEAAPPGPAPADPAMRFDVQVAATTTAAAAQDLVRRLARAGQRARIVPGENGVRRIRLGPFATMAAADSAARAARAVVGGQPFVVRQP